MNPFLTLGIFLISAAGIGWSVKTARQLEREKADLVERIERLEKDAEVPEGETLDEWFVKQMGDLDGRLLKLESAKQQAEFSKKMDSLYECAKLWAGTPQDAEGRKFALQIASDMKNTVGLGPYKSQRMR